MYSGAKVDAVFDLREAVERKVRAEVAVENRPTAAAKDALLDATLVVEERTQHAIEVCHSCGRQHADETDTCSPGENVIQVDFRPEAGERC